MTEAVDFYVFSGTGNTLLVVQEMKKVFEAHGWETQRFRMEQTLPAGVALDRTLGLAFPVAAQATYPLVWRFCEGLPRAEGTPVFMVDTLMMYSGGVVGPLRTLVVHKGYKPIGAREICMPNNLYPTSASAERNAARVSHGMAKARRYAEDLIAGKTHWGRIPVLPDLMRFFANGPWTWWVSRAVGKRLRVDEARCTRCGLCARLCPVDNITMRDLPVHDDHCQQCMRCISFCPTEAISLAGLHTDKYRAVDAKALLDEDIAAQ